MKVIREIAKMQEVGRQVRRGDLVLGLVPTMGFLHDGHLELVRRSRAECDVTVVSIFVNPTQFNDRSDFEAYPRDDVADRAVLAEENVDVLFMPEAHEVYRDAAATTVSVAGLDETLCGPGRPGHFAGVATVVSALFNMVGPDAAFFGEKDYQQLQIIRRMTADLHFPVRIVSVPTLRERDGLAMSSRNARLSAAERDAAPTLYRALRAAADGYLDGEVEVAELRACAGEVLASCESIDVEYLEVVDGETLKPVVRADDRSVIAAAARLGQVRLIDNIIFARARREREAGLRSDLRGIGAETDNPATGAATDA